MKHYDYEISLFLDDELEKNTRKEMFSHLAECEDCMKTFSDLNAIKLSVKEHYNKISPAIHQLQSTQKRKVSIKNPYVTMLSFSFMLLIVAGIVFFVNYNERQILLEKYNSLNGKLLQLEKLQANRIDIKEYPSVKDTLTKVQAPVQVKSIVKKPGTKKPGYKKGIKSNPTTYNRGSQYAQYINSLKAEKITKEDFIIPQLIGN